MCEILAIDSREPVLVNPYLREFYGHAAEHPHGWGLALRRGSEVLVQREGCCALESRLLSTELAEPMTATSALSHIRHATIGQVARVNAHPFARRDESGGVWTLVHNGNVFNDGLTQRYYPLRQGQTDSEAILLYLLATAFAVTPGPGADTAAMRFDMLASAVAAISAGNKLNLAFSDGICTYVHTNGDPGNPSLYLHEEDGLIVASTRPLAEAASGWRPAETCRLLVYRRGALVYRSWDHGHRYAGDGVVPPAEYAASYEKRRLVLAA